MNTLHNILNNPKALNSVSAENTEATNQNYSDMSNSDRKEMTKENVKGDAYKAYAKAHNSVYAPRDAKQADSIRKVIQKLYEANNVIIFKEKCPKHNTHLVEFLHTPDSKAKVCPLCIANTPEYMKPIMKMAINNAYQIEQQNKQKVQQAKRDAKNTKVAKAPKYNPTASQEANDCYENAVKKQHDAPIFNAKNKLINHSLADAYLLSHATFSSFNTIHRNDLTTVLKYSRATAEYYISNPCVPLNVVMAGPSGTGKSHLALSILKEYNQYLGGKKLPNGELGSCLFLNTTQLMNKIKMSFNNNNAKETAQQILKDIDNTSLIVLDDLGSEVNKDKFFNPSSVVAFTQRVLYHILDSRTDTIMTTNLSSKEFNHIYNNRITSRVGNHLHAMSFRGIPDYRINHRSKNDYKLPF